MKVKAVAGLVAMAVCVVAAHGGVISFVPMADELDCEIDAARNYTLAVDFGTSPVANINGVAFTQGLVGALPPDLDFAVVSGSGTPSDHGGNGNHNAWGSLVDLMQDMVYTGNNSAGAVTRVTVSGLGVGQVYDTRIYTRAWSDTPGTRTATITFDPDGAGPEADTVTLSQDDASADPPAFGAFNQAYALSYQFQAGAPDLTIDFQQAAYNMSWHLYGVTNELVRGVPIADLYNTGVATDDDEGLNATLLADGEADPHYRFVSGPQAPPTDPQAQVQANHPAWSANGPDSKWIGVSHPGTTADQAGIYQYETTFTVPAGVDPSSVQVAGYWWADDSSANTQILVNGQNTGVSGSAPFGAAPPGTPFTIDYGDGGARFQPGTNTLTFQVENGGFNPHGVRVNQLAGTYEPASTRLAITDLYNTGVTDDSEFGTNATLLGDAQADPHYRFVSGPQSPPTAPQAMVQANHPAWSANGPDSKWIGVSHPGTTADLGGIYQYETTFTLPAGVDAATAEITGFWWADDSSTNTQILLNGQNAGVSGTAPFSAAYPGTPFTIRYGDGGARFLTGTNTLLFQVENGGNNPHGLRVTRLAGSLEPPSDRIPILDLYNTGVATDDEFGVNAALVANGDADPHYAFVSGPQAPPTAPQAQVQANHPAWAANGPDAKWIGVTANGADNVAVGTYRYETTFSIPAGLDLTTVELKGSWWADNSGTILLNGQDVGVSSSAPFGAAYPGTPFTIRYGDGGAKFVAGTNTLTFDIANAGTSANPSGVRVERLQGSLAPLAPMRRPILDLFNTGVESDDAFGVQAVLLPDGAADPHYRLISAPQMPGTAPQAQVQSAHPAWNGTILDSKWIGVSPAGTDNDEPGVYQYETTFTLPDHFDLTDTEITGFWWADDSTALTGISLNDIELAISGTAPFAAAYPGTPFTINADVGAVFQAGTNTLVFQVENGGFNPHGLRITRLAGTYPIPEPGSLALLGLGLLALVRRRR